MKITKEQIKELSQINSQTAFWCKKNFPEAFEVELEASKWYNYNQSIVCYTKKEDNLLLGYGFNKFGDWIEGKMGNSPEEWTEATEAEVFEALKNEAVKRGFVYNSQLIPIPDESNTSFSDINRVGSGMDYKNGKLYVIGRSRFCIFKDGVWAKSINTITREEAEKLLNKKIIN